MNWITLGLKLLGITDFVMKLVQSAQDRWFGRVLQSNDDLKASAKQGQDAAKINDDVRALSDSALDSELRQPPADK